MLLDDVGEWFACGRLRFAASLRFRRDVKTSFLSVFLEAHGGSLSKADLEAANYSQLYDDGCVPIQPRIRQF
jgi:hypothetical protein